MKNNSGTFVLALILLAACVAVSFADEGDSASSSYLQELQSKWLSIDLGQAISYNEYLSRRVVYDTEIRSVIPFPIPLEVAAEGRVAVIVNSDLLPEIENQLSIWLSDMALDGLEPLLVDATFEEPRDVRNYLADLWASNDGLAGCILVGELPIPWFCITSDFDSYGRAEFPFDLYYRDLDGEFVDLDEDGMFDEHNDTEMGDTRPDIFCGRLYPSGITGDEAEIVNRYLERNHAYRSGQVDLPRRGLLFIDDDWVMYSSGETSAMKGIYNDPNLTVITDEDQTNADEYMRMLSLGYEWVRVMVHSGPGIHMFKYRGGWSNMYDDDLLAGPSDAYFFDLFACSNANFVVENDMANMYVLGEMTRGLAALGSTKTGGVTSPDELYIKLGEGLRFGEAFNWWCSERYPYDSGEMSWDYGLVILGDPTLRPLDTKAPSAPEDLAVKADDEARGFTLSWTEPNAEDLAGFMLHYDFAEGYYGGYPPFRGVGLEIGDSPVDVGMATSFTIKYGQLIGIDKLFVSVTAYDLNRNEGDYSNIVEVPLDEAPQLIPPEILWATIDDGDGITWAAGGTLTLSARASDLDDAPGTLRVEVLLNSQPTGVLLRDDGTLGDKVRADGQYSLAFEVPPRLLPPGDHLITFICTDSDGCSSTEWPYVDFSGTNRTGPSRCNAGLGGSTIHPAETRSSEGPVILGGSVRFRGSGTNSYLQICLEVYHSVAAGEMRTVEIWTNGQPTGLLLDRYSDSGNSAQYWVEVPSESLSHLDGKYLVEAVATDNAGLTSRLFPYLRVSDE